jgi:hypothetical protein
MIYNCKVCAFSSKLLGDYKRHINTKKHKKLTNIINNNIMEPIGTNRNQMEPIGTNRNQMELIGTNINIINKNNLSNVVKDIYKCKYCNKNYTFMKSLYKHQRINCKEIPIIKKNHLIQLFNNNGNTINKLELISNGTKIINNTLNNNNTFNNINIKDINPFSLESIEHISLERMIEIMNSKHKIIKEYCKDLYKLPKNKNAYLDLRNKLIFFIDKDNSIEIETISSMLSTMVENHMETINKYYEKHKDKLSLRTQTLFKNTYNTYFCIININNIDIEDNIIKDSKVMCSLFNDDMKTSLIKVNPETKYLCNEEFYSNNLDNLDCLNNLKNLEL